MKKQLVIIGIIAILVSVGLSGCDEDVDDENDYAPIDDNTGRMLVGWYYVLYWIDRPLDNIKISENNTYLLHFFDKHEKNMRLIANKDTPGDINIGIGTEIGNPIYSFQTIDNQLDRMVVMDYNASNEYYIWTENGDVNVTLLQYYNNYEIPLVYDWITFVKYEGD